MSANDQDKAFEELVAELTDIGRGVGYRGDPYAKEKNPAFDDRHRNIRAREIGAQLNERGGMTLMQEAHAHVMQELGRGPASSLESAWRQIGSWM